MKIVKSFYACGEWVNSEKEGDIEFFFINGEMANVFWLRKGKTEWNGKFIEIIQYY